MVKGFAFLCLVGLLLLSGCSLDYRGAGYAEKLSANTPDSILYNFSTTTIHGAEPYFRIQASTAKNFGKKHVTILDAVKFEEFNSEGKVVATGSADHATYHTDTENAELSGHIELYSDSEKAQIAADWLSWDNAKKTLTGKPGSRVSIVKKSGSGISGEGFEAQLNTRTVRFSGNVVGTWVEDTSK